MTSHSPLLITLMVVNLLSYLLNLLFAFMSQVDTQQLIGFDLFETDFSEDGKYLEITPEPATFSIWGPIYVWQGIWMMYGFSCICRRAPDGPVYTNPALLNPAFYTVSILNWALVDIWYYLAYKEMEWASFVVLALIFITIYICIGLSYKALADHRHTLVKQERQLEIRLIRGIVQNGLALYGTWCTIATLLNMAGALTYEHPWFDQSVSSTIALGILTLEIAVFFLMDWVVIEKHSRYTITPYLVILAALAGSMARNWNPVKRNSIFTAVLMAVGILGFIVKIVLTLVRHFRDAEKQKVILPTTEVKSLDMRL